MKFLLDECLSVRMAPALVAAGHDAVHVDDLGLAGQADEEVLAAAIADGRVLLSADTDFGEILARSNDPTPSVVLFRRSDRAAQSLTETLLANLDAIADDLDAGAFVVITEDRLRVRRLLCAHPPIAELPPKATAVGQVAPATGGTEHSVR